MKKLVLLFSLLISISPSFSQSLTAYDARYALSKAQPLDAQILLNLIYWSYLRSATTLAMQDVLLDQFKNSWMLWLNSATTRRNPRTALPYPEISGVDSTYANLAAQTQKIVNATYLASLHYSLEQNSLLTSKEVKDYMEKVRAEVRNSMTQTIITALMDLEKTFQKMHAFIESVHSKKFIHDMSEISRHLENKNLITDGFDYLINGLALQSFAQFDKKYLASSDQFFNMLAETQMMYAEVWQQLETTRAGYYQELYNIVYTTMSDLNFPPQSFLCLFDEHGLIPAEKQINPLPASLL